jgi:hypothetical protein
MLTFNELEPNLNLLRYFPDIDQDLTVFVFKPEDDIPNENMQMVFSNLQIKYGIIRDAFLSLEFIGQITLETICKAKVVELYHFMINAEQVNVIVQEFMKDFIKGHQVCERLFNNNNSLCHSVLKALLGSLTVQNQGIIKINNWFFSSRTIMNNIRDKIDVLMRPKSVRIYNDLTVQSLIPELNKITPRPEIQPLIENITALNLSTTPMPNTQPNIRPKLATPIPFPGTVVRPAPVETYEYNPFPGPSYMTHMYQPQILMYRPVQPIISMHLPLGPYMPQMMYVQPMVQPPASMYIIPQPVPIQNTVQLTLEQMIALTPKSSFGRPIMFSRHRHHK